MNADEILYLNKDNYIERTLYTQNRATNVKTVVPNVDTATTKAEVHFHRGGVLQFSIDSDTYPSAFDWAIGGSKIRFKFGALTEFAALEGYTFNATIVLYDLVNTNGLEFTPFTVKVSKPEV